jgi:hypothetical protein
MQDVASSCFEATKLGAKLVPHGKQPPARLERQSLG